MPAMRRSRARIGILDHPGSSLGGGQLVVASMARALSQQYDVELIHTGMGYTLKRLEAVFGVDLAAVTERVVTGFTESFGILGAKSILRQLWRARQLSQSYDLFIYIGHGIPPFSYARRGLIYCHFPLEWLPDEELKSDAAWLRRHPIDRWIRSHVYRLLWRLRMRRYRRILANSTFTAGWIERRWGMASQVVYPPVELDVPAMEKTNLIVSVGRFTSSRRSKNQHAQIRAFREFLGNVSGKWSLFIIGLCGDSAADLAYLDSVQRAAQGMPITLLVNADQKIICQSLGKAKLFWHTTGDPAAEAESPHEAEHFGIATVEAMRAGCVPVVIASGGQCEIIEDGVTGFLSKDVDELIRKSVVIACDDDLRCAISNQARLRSMDFTRAAFDERILSAVAEYLSPAGAGARPIADSGRWRPRQN
jgi:glycosyltransferase involved in cell wall biosynthesis